MCVYGGGPNYAQPNLTKNVFVITPLTFNSSEYATNMTVSVIPQIKDQIDFIAQFSRFSHHLKLSLFQKDILVN